LSGRKVDDLRAGVRIEVAEAKLDPLDFALWKASKPGEPHWDSPWGPGRPGWHIECSAMAAEYLGQDFDIHGGGSDLIFPHHENEIAQSEGASGGRFARYWLHNGMVNLEGEKMSKSTGHVIDLAVAIEEFGGVAVRLLYLRAHYRSPLEFSEALVGEAKDALDRIRRVLERAPLDAAIEPDSTVLDRFRVAMDDDFGTPDAIGVLFDAVREANRLIDSGGDPASIVAAVDEIVEVLGIRPPERDAGEGEENARIDALVAERDRARAARDFATSDRIRDELAAMGVSIEDGAGGTRWHRR
jgi:cysteinyl-tRNA synthetase